MNTQVTATGMSVTAKSDQIFLMVKEGHAADADAIQSESLIIDTATNSSAVLLPAAHTLNSSANLTNYDAAASWYYQYSKDPSVSTASSAVFPIDSSSLGQYVLINEFSITVADGSNEVTNLRVANCTITTAGDAAVKVVVAGTNASEEFDGEGGAGSVALRTANLTDSTVEYVKIYIYWDGNDSDVFTNNIADLLGTSVVVTFTGDVVPAA